MRITFISSMRVNISTQSIEHPFKVGGEAAEWGATNRGA